MSDSDPKNLSLLDGFAERLEEKWEKEAQLRESLESAKSNWKD